MAYSTAKASGAKAQAQVLREVSPAQNDILFEQCFRQIGFLEWLHQKISVDDTPRKLFATILLLYWSKSH